jgi:hypothetical protein
MITPEWHRTRAQSLRWLDGPNTRWLAQQHENVAKAIEYRRRIEGIRDTQRRCGHGKHTSRISGIPCKIGHKLQSAFAGRVVVVPRH